MRSDSLKLGRKLAEKIIGARLYQYKDNQEKDGDVVFYAIIFRGKHELIAFFTKIEY